MNSNDIDEYLALIDTRAPDLITHKECVDNVKLIINPEVWNPNKGKSSKMFAELLRNYDLTNVKNALDIGTGSGILALLLWRRGIKNILAVDNIGKSVENAKYNFNINKAKIKIKHSNIFSNVDGTYDLILFNAPATHPKRYKVPKIMQSLWSPERNILMRFLKGLKNHLTKNSRVLFMYSRFSDFDPIPEEYLRRLPLSYSYLETDKKDLSESGIIELRLKNFQFPTKSQ